VFLLWASPYSYKFWLTFKQAKELKGSGRMCCFEIIWRIVLGILGVSVHPVSWSVNLSKTERIRGRRSGCNGHLDRRTRSVNLSVKSGFVRMSRTPASVPGLQS
jgi:hypothetical protein